MTTAVFATRIKPSVQVEQVITPAIRVPVSPLLPSVVIGPNNLIVNDATLGDTYTGVSKTFIFPDFETGAKVNTDPAKLKLVLKKIIVTLLGKDEVLSGTVNLADADLLNTTIPGLFIGIRPGDEAYVKESVASDTGGSIDNTNLSKINGSSGTAFEDALPGDDISVTDTATATTKTGTVISAANGYVIVDFSFPAASGTINVVITRTLRAIVKEMMNAAGTQLRLDRDLTRTANTFYIERAILPTGDEALVNAHQPLVKDYVLTYNSNAAQSDFDLTTTLTLNDSFKVDANLKLAGFTAFNAYPTAIFDAGDNFEVVLSNVSGNTATVANSGGGTVPVDFTDFKVHSYIKLGGTSGKRARITSVSGSNMTVVFDNTTSTDNTVATLTQDIDITVGKTIAFNLAVKDLITGVTVNHPVSQAFDTDQQTTAEAIKSTVEGFTGVGSLILTGSNLVYTITASANYSVSVSDITVTDNSPVITYVGSSPAPEAANGYKFISIAIPEESKPITSANLSISYIALRTTQKNTLIELPLDTDIVPKLGPYHPDNTLCVGAVLMAANTGTVTYAMPVGSDNTIGYLEALSALESKFVYNVCALTNDITIQSIVKSHVDAMSVARKGKWRVAWVNLPQPKEGLTPEALGASLAVNTTSGYNTADTITLSDPRADFINTTKVGNYIQLYSMSTVPKTLPTPSTDGQNGSYIEKLFDGSERYYRIYEVLEVVNSSKVKLKPVPFQRVSPGVFVQLPNDTVATVSNQVYAVSYEVVSLLTITEEAQHIALNAMSFSDRRVLYITNDQCVIDFDGKDVYLPGYFVAAALAGLSSGTLPHQPLTNYPISGIKGVTGGSEHFSSDDQELIAGNGGWLVVQDEFNSTIPYTWVQATTSQGGIKEQEFSFTKNLDEISYAIVADNQSYPGRNNVVAEAKASIESQVRTTLEVRKTKRDRSPLGGYLGSQIISYTIGGLIEDPLIMDLVYSDITVVLPLPLNQIRFRLIA